MKKIEIINKVKDFIINNLNYEEIELFNYLYENIELIAKELNIDEEFIEDKIIDRDSSYYSKIVKEILNEGRIDITVIQKGSLFYLVKLDDINIKKKNKYYSKIEYILNNINDNSKGHIYEEFTLLFLKDIGFKICEHKRIYDGGLDIICSKNIDKVFSGIDIKLNLYGQVKFHKTKVSTHYVKQLIKDKLYKTIIEKNTLAECAITLFISHKGFTEKAKIYAKSNSIILLDTRDILYILFRENKYSSLNFIDREYMKVKTLER